jgi:uracil-DNA glycosylase family 4
MAELRDPDCTRCALHKTAQFVCLIDKGIKRSDIMILGEAPGKREDDTGRPFVGRSGQYLRRVLEEHKVEGFIGNAVNCRPPDNRAPTTPEIAACRYWLDKQLSVVKPKFVLLLGNVALEAALKTKGIVKLRGKPIVKDDITYFPTFHPSYVLRNEWEQSTFDSDVAAFARLIKSVPTPSITNPVLVDSEPAFRRMLTRLRGTISFDIETTGLYPWKGEIVVLGFGTRREQFIVPMPIPDDWMEDLDDVIQDCDLVTQFGKFDSLWLRVKHNIRWKSSFDIGLCHYLIDENAPHDLEYIAHRFLGAEPWDVPLRVKQGKEGIPALIEYFAKDLHYTRALKPVLTEKLEPCLARIFHHIMMPCVDLFTEVEFDGCFINTSKFDEAEEYLRGEVAAALKTLKKWQPPDTFKGKRVIKRIPFNWGSTKQVGHLLFTTLKIPVVERTKKGAASVNESVLKRIDHPLVASLLKLRGAQQQLSFFIDGWKPFLVDGVWLHPSFKLHGTVTGRLSAEHPNLQQVPRDPRIRQLIDAPEGWELIEADLSQIELRIACELARERQMMYAFHHDIDIHWLTLLNELSRTMAFPELITGTAHALTGLKLNYYDSVKALLKAGPDAAIEVNFVWKERRKKAKAINFGYLYGMWWKKFRIYARDNYDVTLTEKEAQDSRKAFFSSYPDIEPWHRRQQNFARRNGYVMSLSGRKRHLPDALDPYDTPARAEALRQAINSPVQSFANELNLMAALQLRSEYPRSIVRICGTVHDSILARVKKEHVVEVGKRLLEIMRHPKLLDTLGIKLSVPVEAELKVGPWSLGVSLEKYIKRQNEDQPVPRKTVASMPRRVRV